MSVTKKFDKKLRKQLGKQLAQEAAAVGPNGNLSKADLACLKHSGKCLNTVSKCLSKSGPCHPHSRQHMSAARASCVQVGAREFCSAEETCTAYCTAHIADTQQGISACIEDCQNLKAKSSKVYAKCMEQQLVDLVRECTKRECQGKIDECKKNVCMVKNLRASAPTANDEQQQ